MRIWLVFGVCAAGILGLVELLTWAGEEERRYQDDLRQSIRRIDNAFSLVLASEAERPHTDYQAFPFLQRDAYSKMLQKIEDREILTPSPLLTAQPDHVRLYFQIDPAGGFSSPQVPTGNFSEIAEMPPEALTGNREVLDHVRRIVDPEQLGLELAKAEKKTQQQVAWVQRARKAAAGTTLEPVWLKGELICARQVRVDGERYLQGFLVDWPKLCETLLAGVRDLFPDATLARADGAWPLHALPAFFDAPRPAGAFGGWTHAPRLLGLLLVGVLAAAFWTILEYAKKQRRFASLVTHELRSPLTTFRLYSDLLAEGLVVDEEKRDVYLKTLQRESDQMARVVETVIAHARIEEGRARLRVERVSLGALLEKIEPDLKRSAPAVSIDTGGVDEVSVSVDAEAVGQILCNLVANAVKYGAPPIEVKAAVSSGVAALSVRDHGDGVPPQVARRIFSPFERGGRGATEPVRGLGLGLTLSRGLARDLGGDLAFERPDDGGARFVLSLPVAS